MTTGPPVLQTGSGNRNALWVIPEVESGKVVLGSRAGWNVVARRGC